MHMPFDAREHVQTPKHVQMHGIARACTGGDMCKHLRQPDVPGEGLLEPEAGLPGGVLFAPGHCARARELEHVRARARGRFRRAPCIPCMHGMHAQARTRGGRCALAARAPNAPICATRAPSKCPSVREDLAGAPPPPRPVRARRSRAKSSTHLCFPAATPGSARPAQAEGAAHLRMSPQKRHSRPHPTRVLMRDSNGFGGETG